ncbi:MAG: hypothetical protein ACMUIU_16060 [bacterium]
MMKSIKIFLNLSVLCSFLLPILFSHNINCQEIIRETLSPESLNRLVSDIYRKPEKQARKSLIGEQSSGIKGKCATPIIRMAQAHPDWLDEENRFILFRPDDSSYVRYYAPDGSVSLAYNTPEGHFKIHYSESGFNAVLGSDGIQSTIPDYVVSFGSYFEQAWDYEIDTNKLGYDPPPSDGNEGGDSRFDIYIKSINYYGYTQVENGHPYIVVHNNYTEGFESNLDPEGSRAGNMKITAAHEFFHAIQYFYDDWNDDCIWWEENTAVWMEDEVFEDVDGYLNYLGNRYDDTNGNLRWDNGETWYKYDGDYGGISGRKSDVWFEAPHISLDTRYTSSFDRYEYGGVMWAKYLAAKFGDDFIKDSFIITDYNTDALTAVQQALQDYGSSIEEAFADFRVKVLTLDPNIFEEWNHYPLVRHEGNYGDYPVNLDLGEDISHLSCCYIGLKPPSGEWKLVIDMDGQDYSDFGVALVLFKDIGHEVRYIPIDFWDEQVGRIEIVSFGTEGLYKRAAVIPMNLSTYQNYRALDIYVQLKEFVQYTVRFRGGINLVSLPENLLGASTSFEFLQNYFNSNVKVQFAGYDSLSQLWKIAYLDDQPKGDLFSIDWNKGYLIFVNEDMNINLPGDLPTIKTIDLMPGRNFISSIISDKEDLLPQKVLESTNSDSGERISTSIQKYEHDKGKRKCGYWFFGKFAGGDFMIEKGEGYMIDMIKGHQGWSPTSSK